MFAGIKQLSDEEMMEAQITLEEDDYQCWFQKNLIGFVEIRNIDGLAVGGTTYAAIYLSPDDYLMRLSMSDNDGPMHLPFDVKKRILNGELYDLESKTFVKS